MVRLFGLLRYKPAIHWLSFGALMSVVALFANLPFLAIEHASGQAVSFTITTLAAVTYAGIITSIVAFATWNYGVAAIGASRAGVFLHLIPVFGSILAVIAVGRAGRLVSRGRVRLDPGRGLVGWPLGRRGTKIAGTGDGRLQRSNAVDLTASSRLTVAYLN